MVRVFPSIAGRENKGVHKMSSLKSMGDRIRQLENERRNLLMEVEELKKMAESRAKALESEVAVLREDVKSLRMLLNPRDVEPERHRGRVL